MPSEDDDSTCRLTTAPSRPLRRPRTAAVLTLLRTRCRLRHQGADRTRPCPHHLNEVDAALLRARMMEVIMLLTSIAVSRIRHSAKRGKSPAPVQLAIPLSHHVFRSGLVPLQLLPCRSMKAMKTRCIPCSRKMSSKGPGSFAHGGHLSFPRNFWSSAAFGLVTLSPRSLLIAGRTGTRTVDDLQFHRLGLASSKKKRQGRLLGFHNFSTEAPAWRAHNTPGSRPCKAIQNRGVDDLADRELLGQWPGEASSEPPVFRCEAGAPTESMPCDAVHRKPKAAKRSL